MSDYDRDKWQSEEAARSEAQSAYRDKMAKARARSAANAKRKISRLHAKLTELGHISDFEDEFGESVLERLDKFGSAFHDREKGRAGDALSIAQQKVVARMKKKVKDLTAKQKLGTGAEIDPDADYVRTADCWKNAKPKRGGFKSKRKSGYTPRVRNIEDELIEGEQIPRPINPEPPKLVRPKPKNAENISPSYQQADPYIPQYTPATAQPKRPILRLVAKARE